MKKRKKKEEMKPYPEGAREGAGEAEGQAQDKAEEGASFDPRPMMLVYAGPAYFAAQARKKTEEAENAMMTGVYAGPGFFAGMSEGNKMEPEEKEEKEEITNNGPAYNQEMPEYVPLDAVAPVPEEEKTQEGLQFFCPSCGKKIELGLKYCPECGASLAALWAETDENVRDSTEEVRGSGRDAADAAGGGDDIDGDSVNV